MSQSILGRTKNERGISLVEVTILLVGIAILAATAMQSLTQSLKDSRFRRTEREMRMLQNAIAGDASVMSVAGGIRSDFGYVGDVGAFPPDLNALVENPGGYATWDGPYLPPGSDIDGNAFQTDEWGQPYFYTGGLELASHGSGSTIRKGKSSDTADYLYNTINGLVRDAVDSLPGAVWMDSVQVEIVIPNGAGSLQTKSCQPDAVGRFTLDSIPIGRHLVRAIYTPELDTLLRQVAVVPRRSDDELIRFNFAYDYFGEQGGSGEGDSMLTLVDGSQQVFGTGVNCDKISFDIANTTGEDVDLTGITLTWSSPTAYYQEVWWESTRVWYNSTPRNESGQEATFSPTQTITDGSTVTIGVYLFKSSAAGGGTTKNMSGVTFTVLFSDGSTFDVTMGECN